ncbi:MAG: site-specific integrase [Oscillospiraceae bacterium]|nr:site-specific integrase [Oscillospiraceae bacterium]
MPASKYKTKSGDVKWKATFRYTDWTGKRVLKKKEGFNKKGDAQEFEREFLLKNSRSCDMSFASLVELYRGDAEHRVREGTQDTQDSIIDKWLLPYFGELQVNEIDAVTIRTWQNVVMSSINPRTGKKYAETYIRSINSRLSAIFNYAVMFYNLKANPCRPAGYMGKKKAGKMKFWTLDEFNLAMAQVSSWSFRVAFQIMYWLGFREGECLALQPADILPSKVARVEKTHHRRKGEDKNGPPKTDNSYRDTSMPDFLYDEILRYIDALCDIQDHDRIFYFQKGTLGRALTEAANAAGVKRIRIHDLRHSHAALLVELGYSIVAVAERLGDTVEVAMSTYSHLYPNKMEAIAADLNRHGEIKKDDPATVISELEKVEKDHKK